MSIEKVLDALVGREGGYANHPDDKGGETMWGITHTVARAFGYHGLMRAMPRSVALRIYTERYYEQPRYNQIAEYNARIAEELLDTGVNMGTGVASRFLQRSLNALNRQGKLYPDIAVDGAIGSMTIAALRAYLAARGKDGEVVLLRLLNGLQSVRYLEISEANKTQEEFLFGWVFNRVEMA